jgi:hypothetical protein
MGFEYSANIDHCSQKEIWKSLNEICVNTLNLEVVSIDDDCFQFNYPDKKENAKFGSDIYIEFDDNLGLYFLLNLQPDVALLESIQNKLKKYDIDIQIEEL